MKRIICFFKGHKWIAYRDYFMVTCSRCTLPLLFSQGKRENKLNLTKLR